MASEARNELYLLLNTPSTFSLEEKQKQKPLMSWFDYKFSLLGSPVFIYGACFSLGIPNPSKPKQKQEMDSPSRSDADDASEREAEDQSGPGQTSDAEAQESAAGQDRHSWLQSCAEDRLKTINTEVKVHHDLREGSSFDMRRSALLKATR